MRLSPFSPQKGQTHFVKNLVFAKGASLADVLGKPGFRLLSIFRRFKPQAFDHRKVFPVPADERAILLDGGGRDQRVECAQAIRFRVSLQ